MEEEGTIPSSIDLKKEMKVWFGSCYGYGKHHINPVCRSSVAILRSFREEQVGEEFPEVRKLSMRLDSELVKIVCDKIKISIKPGEYEFIPINAKNKKWEEYSNRKICKILIPDRAVAIAFSIPENKEISNKKIVIDINFSNVTETIFDDGSVDFKTITLL